MLQTYEPSNNLFQTIILSIHWWWNIKQPSISWLLTQKSSITIEQQPQFSGPNFRRLQGPGRCFGRGVMVAVPTNVAWPVTRWWRGETTLMTKRPHWHTTTICCYTPSESQVRRSGWWTCWGPSSGCIWLLTENADTYITKVETSIPIREVITLLCDTGRLET